ncbi:hypothetical protein KDRO_C00780 [Kluyveromyces lactis]|nr:hypothetical protein KDRO_C00780 [Kluyveromyces lactis]
MSRLRRLDNEVLNHMLNDSDEESNSDMPDGMSFFPMDTAEQQDLIRKLELRNNLKNDKYLKILTFLYLIVCGMFILLATRIKRKNETLGPYKKILLFSAQSISCSVITLRYEFIHKYFKVRMMNFYLNSQRLNILNFVMLIFLSWIILNQGGSTSLLLLCHIPHLLFIVAFIVKRLMTSLDFELGSLRALQYKFKNV